jgi:hypothetical protein
MKTCKLVVILTCQLLSFFSLKAQVPVLSSYTAAPATVFLDFDGQHVAGSLWNWSGPINALPAALSPAAINEIFTRVAEDFRPFNLNVTTDSTFYWNAPVNQRIRIIVTPTYQWYTAAGGVAYVGSFTFGDNTPAWVFSSLLSNNSKYIAEAISHEAGHTLGLQHQSDFDASCVKLREYSNGAGSGEIGWAPIMGVGYGKNLTTWHNGPNTAGCTSWQDDFSIINSANNGFGLRPDDHLNDNANASPVLVTANAFIINGLVNNSADIDVFKLTLSSATHLSLDATPENVGAGNAGANIDIKLALLDAAGDTIARYNPTTLLNAGIDTALNAGDYYFIIDGTSNIYHSDYGSMGYYTLKGFLGNSTLALTNFKLNVQNQGNHHILNWTYQTDEIIDNILIESSADGKFFTELNSLNSTAKSFLAPAVTNAPVYYRLKASNQAKQKTYLSNIARAQNKTNGKKIQVMTTGMNDELTVYSAGRFNYHLLAGNGQLIQTGTLSTGYNQIKVKSSKGLLIFRYNDGKASFSEKIIQQ